jgi:hypothetical protein
MAVAAEEVRRPRCPGKSSNDGGLPIVSLSVWELRHITLPRFDLPCRYFLPTGTRRQWRVLFEKRRPRRRRTPPFVGADRPTPDARKSRTHQRPSWSRAGAMRHQPPGISSSRGSGSRAGTPLAAARTIAMISCTISPRAPPAASLSKYSTAARISAFASSLSTKFQSSSSDITAPWC